jgi:hypothetical protein
MCEWVDMRTNGRGQAYATKEMVLEVELEVGVILDSAEDLENAVRELQQTCGESNIP